MPMLTGILVLAGLVLTTLVLLAGYVYVAVRVAPADDGDQGWP